MSLLLLFNPPTAVALNTKAYRYYRLYSTSSARQDIVGFTEIELAETINGPDTTAGQIYTESSFYLFPSFKASSAFDDDINTAATSDVGTQFLPYWVTVDYGSNPANWKVIKQLRITGCGNGDQNQSPTSFQLQGSDDATTWTTLIKPAGLTWGSFETKSFSVTPYPVVTWNPDLKSQYVTLTDSNMKMYGTPGVPRTSVQGNKVFTSGKVYFELEAVATDSYHEISIGIANGSPLTDFVTPGAQDSSGVTYHSNGLVFRNGGNSGGVVENPWEAAGTFRLIVAVDADAGIVWFGRDGVWTGDPGASGGYTTGMSSYAALATVYGSSTVTLKATADNTIYAPPSGFSLYDSAPAVVVTKLYKGQFLRANVYKGNRTDVQLYRGTKVLF